MEKMTPRENLIYHIEFGLSVTKDSGNCELTLEREQLAILKEIIDENKLLEHNYKELEGDYKILVTGYKKISEKNEKLSNQLDLSMDREFVYKNRVKKANEVFTELEDYIKMGKNDRHELLNIIRKYDFKKGENNE